MMFITGIVQTVNIEIHLIMISVLFVNKVINRCMVMISMINQWKKRNKEHLYNQKQVFLDLISLL